METTCRLVYPSRGIEDEAVWSPHAASFPLLPAALKTRRCGAASFPLFPGASKTRRCGAHTPPCFPSFLGHRRRGGVEPTRRLVSPLPWGNEDEAAWSPHAASFPFFTAASRTRRRGAHTLPRFPSSPWHRRQGGMKPTRRLVSFHSRSVNLVSAPFTFFLPVFRITIFSLMADSCSIKYIIVLPYHECYR